LTRYRLNKRAMAICFAPQSRPIALRNGGVPTNNPTMPNRQQTLAKVLDLIGPFNKKGVEVTESTRFAQDLEWDSLTVLDFVANIEDEFDVIISMNMQAEIESVGQLVDTLEKLKA
jgi:acyl carrier protein